MSQQEYIYTNEELRELEYLRSCALEHFMDEMNHVVHDLVYAWKRDANNTDTLLVDDNRLPEQLMIFIKNNISSNLELYDTSDFDDDQCNDTDNNYDEYY